MAAHALFHWGLPPHKMNRSPPSSPWISVPTGVASSSLSKTSLVLASMLAVIILLLLRSPDAGETPPFTIEEWMWAAQGGYIDKMLVHLLRHGGV